MEKVLQPVKNHDRISVITADPSTHATIVYYQERRRSILTELKALDHLIACLKELTGNGINPARPE